MASGPEDHDLSVFEKISRMMGVLIQSTYFSSGLQVCIVRELVQVSKTLELALIREVAKTGTGEFISPSSPSCNSLC